jgi:hypothetical protein
MTIVKFPRKKSDELQEALGHLEYFRSQVGAIEFALKRLGDDRRLCEKGKAKWEKRIETLVWCGTDEADKT